MGSTNAVPPGRRSTPRSFGHGRKPSQAKTAGMAILWLGLALGAGAILVLVVTKGGSEPPRETASAAPITAAPTQPVPAQPSPSQVPPRLIPFGTQDPANKEEALQQAATACNQAGGYSDYLAQHPNLSAAEKANTEIAIQQSRALVSRLRLKFDLGADEIAEAAKKAASTGGGGGH